MRILVAEDETIIRLDLRELLERAGFEVCAEARDGVEAVELARSEEPDLAVLDVKMPRLDGIEAARRILDERPIPIVMLTAYGQDELVSRAVEAGVFGYLVKPFREADLLPAIRTARARHEELVTLRPEEYAAQVRERVGEGPLFLSFDVDVLDPAFAPGTGTPEAGGLTTREALGYVRALRGLRFSGFDVVEVSPPYDGPGQPTAIAAANVAYELLTLDVLAHA